MRHRLAKGLCRFSMAALASQNGGQLLPGGAICRRLCQTRTQAFFKPRLIHGLHGGWCRLGRAGLLPHGSMPILQSMRNYID
jgi:hypothetical protein